MNCPLSEAIASGAAKGLRLKLKVPLAPLCLPSDPEPRKAQRVDQAGATDLAFVTGEFFEERHL